MDNKRAFSASYDKRMLVKMRHFFTFVIEDLYFIQSMLHMKYTNDTISCTIHQIQNALFHMAFIGIKKYKNNNI